MWLWWWDRAKVCDVCVAYQNEKEQQIWALTPACEKLNAWGKPKAAQLPLQWVTPYDLSETLLKERVRRKGKMKLFVRFVAPGSNEMK